MRGFEVLHLPEWVSLSSLCEEKLSSAADGDDPITERQARLHRIAGCAHVASSIVDCILYRDVDFDSDDEDRDSEQPLMLQPDDVAIDNFKVEIFLDTTSSSFGPGHLSSAEIIENCSLEQIKKAVELPSYVEFTSTELMRKQGLKKDDKLQDVYFRRLGQLFYKIFLPGASLPSTSTDQNDEQSAAHLHHESSQDSNPSHQKEQKVEEEPGSEKGRRKHTIHETCKMFKKASIREEIEMHSLPTSIRRLLLDLLEEGLHREKCFETINDVILELDQIVSNPQIFLDEVNTGQKELDFQANGMFGRDAEVANLQRILEVAQAESASSVSNFVLVGGESGSGKSALMKNISEKSGWLYLRCKFDRLSQYQPSYTIASAFEEYFRHLVYVRPTFGAGNNFAGAEEAFNIIMSSIEDQLTPAGIATLAHVIPSFRALFPDLFRRVVEDDSDDDHGSLGGRNDNDANNNGDAIQEPEEGTDCLEADTYKARLHYCFKKLVNAITSPTSPAILVIDDLQWADSASLDLLSSLLTNSRQFQLMGNGDGQQNASCLVIAGTYRSDEVDDDHLLTGYLKDLSAAALVRVSKIDIDGISLDDTNAMISCVLHLPVRLTRGLASVVHTKTLGNPLFVKTFIEALVKDGFIWYSLKDKRWLWEIDAVKSQSVDDDVARILARKIKGLPDKLQHALSVASCFGMQVDEHVLQLLSTHDKYRDVVKCLKGVISEGLPIIEKRQSRYVFSHDKVWESVYGLLGHREVDALHFNIGLLLIEAWKLNDSLFVWENYFIAIDQINTARSTEVTDPELQKLFAMINLRASERSVELANSFSAMVYARNGLRHLGSDCWSVDYQLCLQLHDAACLACYLNVGGVGRVSSIAEEVSSHAQNFMDRIKTQYVLTRTLGTSGKPEAAVAKAFLLIEQLGEKLPVNVTASDIQHALVSMKHELHNVTKEQIECAPRLVDKRMHWVLKILDMMCPFVHVVCPQKTPIIGCKMIEISLRHGYCRESAFGFILFGYSYLSFFRDINEGYGWAKVSLLVLRRFGAKSSYRAKYFLNNFFAFWAEPVQSTAQVLAEMHCEGLMAGDTEYAIHAFSGFMMQSFYLCGTKLTVVEKNAEQEMTARLQANQFHLLPGLVCMQNTIFKFNGNGKDAFDIPQISVKNEDEMMIAYSSNQALCKMICLNQLYVALFFHKFDEVIAAAKTYKALTNSFMWFQEILVVFFSGLAAFHLSRSDVRGTSWISVGENSVRQLQSWVENSEWNFQNKLLILEAELYNSKGDHDLAHEKYKAAIESARKHHFIHEEGLSHELLAAYYKSQGQINQERECMTKAVKCYKEWGAHGLLSEPRFDGFR